MLENFLQFLSAITPDTWIGKLLAGAVAAAGGAVFLWLVRKTNPYVYGTEEFQARVKAQRAKDAAAKHDNEVVYACKINGTEIKLLRTLRTIIATRSAEVSA